MLYVTGDVHADTNRFWDPAVKSFNRNDYLLVTGDFGFVWDDSKEENKILDSLSKLPYNILFVDGPNENFNLLKNFSASEFMGGKARFVRENVVYLMRGEVYTIEGKTVFTFGGGESENKDEKVKNGNWYKEEMPTIDEMKYSVKQLNKFNRIVDFVVTHEPPATIRKLFGVEEYNINMLNYFFDDMIRAVSYKKWYFGSFHENKMIPPKYICLFDDIRPME